MTPKISALVPAAVLVFGTAAPLAQPVASPSSCAAVQTGQA